MRSTSSGQVEEGVLMSYLAQFRLNGVTLRFKVKVLNLLKRKFKKFQKSVDIKTELRRMRISLQARLLAGFKQQAV